MALLTIVFLLLVLAASGCGGDDDSTEESRTSAQETTTAAEPPPLLPEGGSVPAPQETELEPAARAAGCELESTRATSNAHSTDPNERIPYDTNPPTTGRHLQVPAEDGIYEEAPPDSAVVHSMEHGRIVIWFKPDLPAEARASLRAFVEADNYQMLLVPREDMPYDVAATAWNAEPGRLGTGRLLGCPSFEDSVFDALRAFRDEHRGKGPEAIP
jgi:hypothetical protein